MGGRRDLAYVSLALFLIVVSGLTIATLRGRGAVQSCCAPADPADDLRMRAAFEGDGQEASQNYL